MSAKPRCHECGHPKGPRREHITKAGTNKKPSCNCKCHERADA